MDVLVVDGDAVNAEIVAGALRKRYPTLKVDVARYGTEAIEKVSEEDCPSLVIVGYNTPAMEGRELGRLLKQSYGTRVKILVMATKPAMSAFPVEMEGGSIDGTMEKPVDLAGLYAKIEGWFPRRLPAAPEGNVMSFRGPLKAARGKLGILVPRQAAAQCQIDPNDEYEVFLRKSRGKRRPAVDGAPR